MGAALPGWLTGKSAEDDVNMTAAEKKAEHLGRSLRKSDGSVGSDRGRGRGRGRWREGGSGRWQSRQGS